MRQGASKGFPGPSLNDFSKTLLVKCWSDVGHHVGQKIDRRMAVENFVGEAEMKYTSRGLRRRRGTDKWEVILSHRDPATGKSVTTYHTVEAKSEKQAQKKRNDLILELELMLAEARRREKSVA